MKTNKFLTAIIATILLSCSKTGSIDTGPSPDGIAGSTSTITTGGSITTGGGGVVINESGGDVLIGSGSSETAGANSGAAGGSENEAGSAGILDQGMAGSVFSPDGGSAGADPFSTGATYDLGTGGTIDLGTGGEGNTIDLGTGGTVDLGTGGTVDLGTGGTVDLGTGGSVDLGTGGTTDLCITTCTPGILGFGEEAVNLLVFENAEASGCDTEGRMWVGGNATLSGYGVGAQLSSCDEENYVLVVGGDLSINGGIKGKIWVGGEVLEGTAQCGGVWPDLPPPVDFDSLEETLIAYSTRLSEYETNGTTDIGSPTVFTGTDTEMNVFSISGADMLSSNGFTFNVPVESTVIVNVSGTEAGFSGGTTILPDGVVCGSGAVSLDDFCNKLIWNFYETEVISVSNTSVQGSILAPLASFGNNGSGQVNGTVIVNNFEIGSCVEMHPHYFNGCLCTETGEYACCVE
jgi:choice-of-anchor A domain-containing protein